MALSPGQTLTITLPQGEGTRQLRWINDLEYQGMKLNAIFQTDKDKTGALIRSFAHLCCRPIDRRNACQVATAARLRWRCENEGFNVLKNGGFALEHVYSHNPLAAKGYVLLMLTAHLVQQLLTRGRLGTVFKTAFHTFRNYGKKMLAALLSQPLPPDFDSTGFVGYSSGFASAAAGLSAAYRSILDGAVWDVGGGATLTLKKPDYRQDICRAVVGE